MSENLPKHERALVAVFEKLSAAEQAVEALKNAGFDTSRIEVVRHNVKAEAPEVETPKVRKETEDVMIEEAEKWAPLGAGIGAATGLLATLLTPFPGVGLTLVAAGGLLGGGIGGAMAGISGIEFTDRLGPDDSVNLPTLDEYQELVDNGHTLVVVLGSHEEAMRARDIISKLPFIHNNIHVLHGHEFHEHPAHPRPEKE